MQSHRDSAKHTPFTEEQWQAHADNWNAWWRHDTDQPMLIANGGKPSTRARPDWWRGHFTSIPFDVPAEAVAEELWDGIANTIHYGDSWPSCWMNFGPGIGAGFLGGGVVPSPSTTWFTQGIWEGKDLRDIKPEYDPDNEWLKRVRDIMHACVAKFDGRATIGFSDIGGNLDIAASLRDTQTLLTDTYDDPDGVTALAQRITAIWQRFYTEERDILARTGRGFRSWLPLWAPGGTYELQSDFCYMISPAQFERWVLPDLVACCEFVEYPIYHLDGLGELPHLDMILSIEKLRGVQWNPGDGNPPATTYRDVLRRIRAAGKLVQIDNRFSDVLTLAKEFPLEGFAIGVGWIPNDTDPAAALAEIRRVNKGVK